MVVVGGKRSERVNAFCSAVSGRELRDGHWQKEIEEGDSFERDYEVCLIHLSVSLLA